MRQGARKRIYERSCGRKRKYSKEVAERIATRLRQRGEDIRAYPCGFCARYHLGHPNLSDKLMLGYLQSA